MLQTRESEVVASVHQILDQVRRVVTGKDEALLWVLAALLSGGHILLEDVPGVGKTTMALSFARALDLEYGRVQFTPDVLPSDVTGYSVPDGGGNMTYRPGGARDMVLYDVGRRCTENRDDGDRTNHSLKGKGSTF